MASGLLKSISTISLMTLFSRILGFIRDVIFARLFGAVAGYDAFLVAFRIPNFFRALFAEGAFAQAFVPLLSEQQAHADDAAFKASIDNIAGCLAFLCLLLTVVGMIAAPWVIQLFAPGFSGSSKVELASELLRITFPYLFFVTMLGLAGGILNSVGYFALTAFAPVLLNISLIIAAVFFSPYCQHPMTALAWGVIAGGLAQVLLQLPLLHRLKLLPRFRLNFQHNSVKKLWRLMLPALLGVSVSQINVLMSTVFASFLISGSISWLYYADRLMQFPLGVFGVALSTAVLPHLAKRHAEQNELDYSRALAWACQVAVLIALPAAVGLFLLAIPLLSTLFQYGRFNAEDVQMTALALRAYALGLLPFVLIKVMAAAFYARMQMSVPVRAACLALVLNLTLCLLLLKPFAHAGLALANSLAALVNVGFLLYHLVRQDLLQLTKARALMLLKLLLALTVMAVFLFWAQASPPFWLNATVYDKVAHLIVLVSVAMFIYAATLWLLGLRWQSLRFEDNRVE